MPETVVVSFMVRFVLEKSDTTEEPQWRGIVRHVQTGKKLYFTSPEEARAFIYEAINRTVTFS